MFCSQCGTKNQDSSKFCSSCGNQLLSVINNSNNIHTAESSNKKDNLMTWAYKNSLLSSVVDGINETNREGDNEKLWKNFLIFFSIGIVMTFMGSMGYTGEDLNIMIIVCLFIYPIVYFCIKYQAIDKSKPYWIIPIILLMVWGWIDGIVNMEQIVTPNKADLYNTFISGIPETYLLIKIFLNIKKSVNML